MVMQKVVDDLVLGVGTEGLGAVTLADPGTAATAAIDPAKIPTTLNDLTTQVSRTYDLSVTAASEFNIPIVGSVSGGINRRVFVLERTAYKEIRADSGKYHYGYAIRLGVTVSKLNAGVKISLPFLAASSELGQIEAKWILQVVGLSGPSIDRVAIPPTELNVETFVLAKQSLNSLIEAVRDATTQFTAELLAMQKQSDEIDREYLTAIGKAYALSRIGQGRNLLNAMKDLHTDREEMRDAIGDVYRDFAGLSVESANPSNESRNSANKLLANVRIEPRT